METLLTEKQIIEVQDVLIEELGVKREQLALEARFVEDFNADSLTIVEIIMRIEDQFNVTIPDDEVEKISSVGDFLETLGRKVGETLPTERSA
jgi:acyl carrier protein